MHLDGFEPWEIQVAIRKKHRLLAEEQRKEREDRRRKQDHRSGDRGYRSRNSRHFSRAPDRQHGA